MTEAQNPMSPSLAGIVSDPNDSSRRIVPASQRADGSVRKERKVRPGHVPAEDVAKYRPGQGSLRAQHVAAQASHQAPPSPSPTPASTIRRPNPADFLTESRAREQQQQQQQQAGATTAVTSVQAPPASPTKSAAKSSGASSSRWATSSTPSVEAAPAPTPAPAPAPVPLATTTTAGRGKPRTRGGARQGKARAPPSDAEVLAVASTEAEETVPPSIPAEDTKENIPEKKTVEPEVVPSVPSTPESKIPDLPETPGGDWWEDEDEDEEVDAAAQALQGISIKDTAQRQRQGSPTPPSQAHKTMQPVQQQPRQQNTTSAKSANGHSNSQYTQHETQSRTPAKKPPQQPNNSKATPATGNKGSSGDLLSRLGPPVPVSAPESTPTSAPAQSSEAEKTRTVRASTDSISKMTMEEIRSRARTINQELRQLNQLRRYAGAGAVLSKEQKTEIDGSTALLQELSELKSALESLSNEVTQLLEASRS